MWIVYCAQKDAQLRDRDDRFFLNFDWCISEIFKSRFRVVATPAVAHRNQKCFLLFYHGYPILVPYRKRAETIQLITFFPDRRFKHEE